MSLSYGHYADVVLVRVLTGVYKVTKCRYIPQGRYIDEREVVGYLNSNKVVIYDERMVFIHKNFEIGGQS